MNWDRIQRLEHDLQQAMLRIRRLDDLNVLLLDENHALRESRDLARRVAMRLEEECHDLSMELETAPLDAPDVVRVPVWGEAT